MKKYGLLLMMSLCGVNSLSQAESLTDLVLGNYYNNDYLTAPLLANSKDQGKTWEYQIFGTTPSLPVGSIESQLIELSCNKRNCVAVGQYREEDPYTFYPLLAHSKDRGESWSYIIDKTTPKLPEGFKLGGFSSVSCSKAHCIAAGYYRTDNGSYYPLNTNLPLIATSQNRGKTWTYTLDGSNLPEDFEPGSLAQASCAGLNCVVVGNFGSYAHIIYSKDGGNSWEYVVDSQKPKFPGDFFASSLTSLNCSGLNCIAAGYYLANATIYPLLLSSQDGGAHWNYAIDINTLPSPDLSFGWFTSVSCSNANCVAVGMYNKGSAYPLVANSRDGGKTWVYAVDSDKPSLPANFANGKLYSVSCSDRHCVAVGQYSNSNSESYPLAVTSENGGKSWVYTLTSENNELSAIWLNGVKCNSLHCIISGNQLVNEHNYPVLANSYDGGFTWSNVIDKTKLALPLDATDAYFFSLEKTNSLLPKSLSFLENK